MCSCQWQTDDGNPDMTTDQALLYDRATVSPASTMPPLSGSSQPSGIDPHSTVTCRCPIALAEAEIDEAAGSAQDEFSAQDANRFMDIATSPIPLTCSSLELPRVPVPLSRLGHARTRIRGSCRDPAASGHLRAEARLLILNQSNHFGTSDCARGRKNWLESNSSCWHEV
jgi:hypothetical protein